MADHALGRFHLRHGSVAPCPVAPPLHAALLLLLLLRVCQCFSVGFWYSGVSMIFERWHAYL